MKRIQLVVEKHPDGFVAYPLGLKGVVVGQGDTAAAAQADCESAMRFLNRAASRKQIPISLTGV